MTDRIGSRNREKFLKIRELVTPRAPYNLVCEMGAPEDEYDPEVADIYDALASGTMASEAALAQRLAEIFGQWFGIPVVAAEWTDLARDLWRYWQEKRG
jgi:hypothetical protein